MYGKFECSMTRASRLACWLTVTGLISSPSTVHAGHHFCKQCGCEAECRKVCRLKCEEKKVEVVCWGCKEEDFCVGRPSRPGCEHCESVCQDESDDSEGVCTCATPFVWTEWIPGCGAKMFTRQKLMKKTVTKKVPTYKWVVEDLCADCEAAAKESEGKTKEAKEEAKKP